MIHWCAPPIQVTFWALHWAKGSVIGDDQGEYNDKTLWEQLDQGVPWTATKKFLLFVPVAVCVRRAAPRPAPRAHLALPASLM